VLEISEECRARWQESVPLLRASLRRDPERQDAIFTLGLAYLYSGRPGDALNYLRIAHQRQPWAAHVNFYLGETYRLVGDVRAREHLIRARQWSSTEIWRRLAEAGLDLLAATN
jgi:predicted Zn-dependent protease